MSCPGKLSGKEFAWPYLFGLLLLRLGAPQKLRKGERHFAKVANMIFLQLFRDLNSNLEQESDGDICSLHNLIYTDAQSKVISGRQQITTVLEASGQLLCDEHNYLMVVSENHLDLRSHQMLFT
nr:uncharacterized protein LOC117278900 [Nicotiana tomentosiformis]